MATYRVENHKGKWNLVKYEGNRRTKKVIGSGLQAKAEAARLAAELTLAAARQAASLPSPIRLGEYAERWYRQVVLPHKKPGTAVFYRSVLDHHILPALGNLPLVDVSREHIKALLADLVGRRAKGTVKNILAICKILLHEAVEDGYIAANPAAKMGRVFPLTGPTKPVEALDAAQVGRLLRVAEKHMPDWALLFRTLFYTGLRQGEVVGLQWDDVDPVRGMIRVRRNVWHRVVGTPKSGRERSVDIPSSLRDALVATRQVREAKASLASRPLEPWVFPAEDPAQPLSHHQLRYRWLRLCRLAGIPPVKPHITRHTYASLMLRRGVPIAYVKEQLGHSSIQITVDLYGHFVPGADRHHVEGYAQAFEDEPSPTFPPPSPPKS